MTKLPLLLFLLLTSVTSLSHAAAPASPSHNKNNKPDRIPRPPSGDHTPPLELKPSSAVFPIHGDVYPNGIYYVSMTIGGKPYFLDIDTGSDLTWLQCDAPCVNCVKGPHPLYKPQKNSLVRCRDPLCVALQQSTNRKPQCDSPQQCDYEIDYADGLNSLGVLVTDVFSLRLTSRKQVQAQLAFGCGYNQEGGKNVKPMDGMLGLGNGKAGIISQLSELGVTKNVVGHCLGRRGGGYLFFGDSFVPTSGVTWVPMSQTLSHYYSPGSANVYFGKQSLGIKDMPVVFDSGASYSYFTKQPYHAVLSALKNDLQKKPLKEAPGDEALPVCWRGPQLFKSVLDVKKYFTSLVLSFAKGKALFEIPPENYLIVTKQGNACLGILNGTDIGLDNINIIGDISFQDHMVIYNNENKQIGWFRMSCDRLPNPDDIGGLGEGFCEPQFEMGIFRQDFPACYNSQIDWSAQMKRL